MVEIKTELLKILKIMEKKYMTCTYFSYYNQLYTALRFTPEQFQSELHKYEKLRYNVYLEDGDQ